jgi:hypothetical protein
MTVELAPKSHDVFGEAKSGEGNRMNGTGAAERASHAAPAPVVAAGA